jgi:ClpP class serine protease
VSKKAVVDSFGQGKVFTGLDAISLGMADKKGTWLQTLARLAPKARGAVRAAVAPPAVQGDAEPLVASGAKTVKAGLHCECSPDCPCQDDEDAYCPEDCPTCEPDCGCTQHAAAAKADLARAASDTDAAAIAAALSGD